LSTEYRSSSNWLKINSANAGAGANKYLILEPSTQYQLTFTADKASVSYFAIVVATLSSTNSLSIFATQNVTANGLQTFTFTTPSSIPMNVVMIQLRQAGIYYIDNFAIKKVSPSYVLEIGDFESGAQVANTVMDYYDEWYNRPNHLIAVSQNNSMDRVRITNGDPFDCLRRYVSVTPNQQYTFRGKIVGAQGGNVRVMRMASGSSSMTLVTYQMITTNDGYVQFNFTPTQNQVLITVNAPGTYYLEDVAVYKTANQTKYTPTTHEKVLPTFTNATNMSQYGATVQSSPSASSWGSSGGYSAQQINKGDYIQFEIGSDALTNYYRPAVGISYTPSGKDMGMDYNWYFSGSSGEYQIYTAGGSRTRYITPYTLQNGNRYKIWRNNGNVEFYINDVLNRSFQDMYPDRPMYLEIAFGESNKKVENLYIYKEVVKTSNVVETTHLVAKGDYRYGYQGSERDDQVKGRGNSYTTEFRQYDPRLGRWLTIDPEADNIVDESPYNGMGNNPIVYNDPDGDCPWCALIDYAWQVGSNLIEGKSAYDAFIGDVDFVSVAVSAIPGGKGIMKGTKLIGEGYTLITNTTLNKGVEVKSKKEIILGGTSKYISSKAVTQLKKVSSDKMVKKVTSKMQKLSKKVNNQEAKLKRKPNHEGTKKKIDVLGSKLDETRKQEVAVKTLNKAFGKLDEKGWEAVQTNIEKGVETTLKEASESSNNGDKNQNNRPYPVPRF